MKPLQKKTSKQQTFLPVYLIFIIGLSCTSIITTHLNQLEHKKVEERFIQRTQSITHNFQIHLNDYNDTVRLLKAFFLSSEFVEKDEFELLSISTLLYKNNVSGMFFIPNITPEKFEEYKDLHLKTHGKLSYDLTTTKSHKTHYPVLYSESMNTRPLDVGLNIANIPALKNAIEKSKETSASAMSELVKVNTTWPQLYIFHSFSIDKDNKKYTNILQRYHAKTGTIGIQFSVEELISEFQETNPLNDINLNIKISSADQNIQDLYNNISPMVTKRFLQTDTFEALSKTWHLSYTPKHDYFNIETRNQFLIMIIGLILSLGLSYYYYSLLKKTEKDKETQRFLNQQVREKERLNKQMSVYNIKLEEAKNDLTDLNKKLKKEKNKAEKANQAKSDFLANMSHELRTPLNSIIGLSKIIMNDNDKNTEIYELGETIQTSSKSLLYIVNDILDLSKIEAKQMQIENIGFCANRATRHVIRALSPLIKNKDITLDYEHPEEDMPYLLGDPLKVESILNNLIGNAIKYTHKGNVTVTLKCEETSEETAEIYWSVKDSGIGISKEKQISIFDKFSQADESTTRKYGGTGLGLAITKELVEMMGGTIGVNSEENKGSEFWVKIPFKITDKMHEDIAVTNTEKRKPENLNNKIKSQSSHVLIAEDHKMNQILIKKILSKLNFTNYDLVENGEDAVNAFKSNQYDLVLMDCHMPKMNGYEASVEIRKFEENSPGSAFIIALTADAMPETKENCLNAGMDEYVSKPIDMDILREILENRYDLSDENEE